MLSAGTKQSEIARKFKVSQSAIAQIKKKMKETGSSPRKVGSGRSTLATETLRQAILPKRRENPFLSLRRIAIKVSAETGETTSYSTVKGVLNDNTIFSYPPASKPRLSPAHKKLRVAAAREWMKYEEEDIKKIMFSDESKFNLFTSNGKRSVWREPGKRLDERYVAPTVKHGDGSVMVWGCFSYGGMGQLHFIDGNMDSYEYTHILALNLKKSCRDLKLKDFISQQDNDKKHVSEHTKHWMAIRHIKPMLWPQQSPDLNPIENLWAIVKAEVARLAPQTIAELKAAIIRAWKAIPDEVCRNLP